MEKVEKENRQKKKKPKIFYCWIIVTKRNTIKSAPLLLEFNYLIRLPLLSSLANLKSTFGSTLQPMSQAEFKRVWALPIKTSFNWSSLLSLHQFWVTSKLTWVATPVTATASSSSGAKTKCTKQPVRTLWRTEQSYLYESERDNYLRERDIPVNSLNTAHPLCLNKPGLDLGLVGFCYGQTWVSKTFH